MAEHRPYRPPHASSGDLRRIKALAGTAIALAFVATNSVATQHAAAALAHSTYLGSEFIRLPRIGRLYLPWEWLVWAARWHSIPQLWPIWVTCLRTAVYPMALIAPAAIGVIAIMRGDVFGRRADLHGSARWATSRDLRRAGLLPQRRIVRRLSRQSSRVALVRAPTPSAGIYLARWKGGSRVRFPPRYRPRPRAGLRSDSQRKRRRSRRTNSFDVASFRADSRSQRRKLGAHRGLAETDGPRLPEVRSDRHHRHERQVQPARTGAAQDRARSRRRSEHRTHDRRS